MTGTSTERHGANDGYSVRDLPCHGSRPDRGQGARAHRDDDRVRRAVRGAARRSRAGCPARRRLRRDDGLRPAEHSLGDDGFDAPARGGRLRGGEAGARRGRHALPLVPDERLRGGRQRRALPLAGRLRRREGRGGPARAARRRSDPRRRHPRHGARRPDSPVLPEIRGLQGPGAGERRRPRDPGRRRGSLGGGLLRDRSRVRSRRTRGGDHERDSRPHDRNRRRRRLRRTGPGLSRRHGSVERCQPPLRAALRESCPDHRGSGPLLHTGRQEPRLPEQSGVLLRRKLPRGFAEQTERT